MLAFSGVIILIARPRLYWRGRQPPDPGTARTPHQPEPPGSRLGPGASFSRTMPALRSVRADLRDLQRERLGAKPAVLGGLRRSRDGQVRPVLHRSEGVGSYAEEWLTLPTREEKVARLRDSRAAAGGAKVASDLCPRFRSRGRGDLRCESFSSASPLGSSCPATTVGDAERSRGPAHERGDVLRQRVLR